MIQAVSNILSIVERYSTVSDDDVNDHHELELCADFKLFSNEVLECNTITTIKTFQECHPPTPRSLGNDKIFIISPFPYFGRAAIELSK